MDTEGHRRLTFEIEKASWRDLNDLRKLDQICFGVDAWPLLDLIAVLTLPKVIRLKAVVGGRLAGFIAGDPHQGQGIGWIVILGVLPEYRRQGIAEKLLEECERWLSFSQIRLSVRASNEPAINLYRKAGYQKVDFWRNYYHSGEDALVLEKRR